MNANNPISSTHLQQNSYWRNFDNIGAEESVVKSGRGVIAANSKLCDDFDADVSAVHQDGDLSAQGRTAKLLALSARYTKSIDAMAEANTTPLIEQIAKHRAALTKAASGPDASAVQELRAQEVRKEFAAHDPVMRASEYHRLNDAGRHEAARAIEDAPGVPLIDAATAAEGRANRGARTLPDRAIAMQTAQDVLDVINDSTRLAKRHVALSTTGDGLSVTNDAISMAARGTGAYSIKASQAPGA